MPPKELLASISLVLYSVGYIPYFRDIFAGKTKPHMISWGIWVLLMGAVFVLQVQGGAGAGAWHTGLIVFFCFCVFLTSFWYGYRDIRKIDIACGIACIIAFPIWLFTRNPLIAMILFVSIDIISCIPTIRKTWQEPGTETILTWLLIALSTCFTMLALNQLSIVTLLSPLWNLMFNIIIVSIILFHGSKR